jgi:hypothetical protein
MSSKGAAVPADGQEGADHVVAGLEPAAARADLLDDPGSLVPAYQRTADRDVAGAQVIAGMAQAGRDELDEHLPGLRRVKVKFGDLPVLAYAPG